MQAIVVIFLKKSCLYELHLNGLISTPKSCKVALHSNSSFCYDCLLLCSCSLVVVEYSWWLDPTTCCRVHLLSRTRDVMWLYIFAVCNVIQDSISTFNRKYITISYTANIYSHITSLVRLKYDSLQQVVGSNHQLYSTTTRLQLQTSKQS